MTPERAAFFRALPDPPKLLAEIIAERAKRVRARCKTLAGFVREAWHVLEPHATYIHNWHIDAVCDHLEAVTYGDITRLLINVPPGSMKSLLVSVFWPAWEWTIPEFRSYRYVATAFNEGPVKRDTRKMRDLIASTWYQALWPEIVLTRFGETSIANMHTGSREGVPFGSLTSQRGDRLIIDDPHSTETAESDTERAATTRKFREGAINRLNDQKRSAIVIIMQRLHEEDVSGQVIALKMGYVYLCLPMEFEADRRCITSIGFRDPRTRDGELLDPVRFDTATVASLKRDTTAYAYAGQYQQRPAPRAGNMFKRHWFIDKMVKAAPPDTRWVRHWDLAATKKISAARTAGVKLGRDKDGRFYVGNVILLQEEGTIVRRTILSTAQTDTRRVEISLPQDPGQAGKVQAQDNVAMLAGYIVKAEPETGEKEIRAMAFAAQCEIGNVCIVEGDWNQVFFDELFVFPTSKFKDQVDACSGAFGYLVTTPAHQPTRQVQLNHMGR